MPSVRWASKIDRQKAIAVIIASAAVLAAHPNVFSGIYEYMYAKSVPLGAIEIQGIDTIELSGKLRPENLVLTDSILAAELVHFVGIADYHVEITLHLPHKRWSDGDVFFCQASIQDTGKNRLQDPYIHTFIVDASHVVVGHYPKDPYPTLPGKWISGAIYSHAEFLKPTWYSFNIKKDLIMTQYGDRYVVVLVFDNARQDNRAVASAVAVFEVFSRTEIGLMSYVWGVLGIISSWVSVFVPVWKSWTKLESGLVWVISKYWYMTIPMTIAILYSIFR